MLRMMRGRWENWGVLLKAWRQLPAAHILTYLRVKKRDFRVTVPGVGFSAAPTP